MASGHDKKKTTTTNGLRIRAHAVNVRNEGHLACGRDSTHGNNHRELGLLLLIASRVFFFSIFLQDMKVKFMN